MTLSARDLLTLRSLPDAWTVADLARLRCIERDSAQHLADQLEKKAAIAKEGRFYRTLEIDLCAKPPPKPRAPRRACPPNAAECGTWKMPKKTQAGAPLALGPTVPLYDSEGRSYAAQWAIIDLSDLAPSHRSDSTATPGYPLELQARDRGAAASRLQIQALASTLNAARLISPSSSPTDSAPIVWSPNQAGPFFVVSGNGRAMALRQWLTTSAANVAAYWLAILARWKWPAQADMHAQRRANSGPPIACVRIVTGTRAQAVQLAGASQATAAASETTAERATGRGRSAGVTTAAQLAALGPFAWTQPINASTVQAFASANPRFWSAALETVAADRRPSVAFDDGASALLINDLLLAVSGLPASKKTKPEVRDALNGALPAAWSLHLDTRRDEVPPAWDIWERFAGAREWAMRAKDPAALLAKAKEATRQTGAAAVDWLAVGLAALLMRAASRSSPADAAAELAALYVGEAETYSRSQSSMFPPTGTPLDAMGRLVRLDLSSAAEAQTARTTKPKAAEAPAPAPAPPFAAPSPPPRDPFPPELLEAFALERLALNRLNAALKLVPFRFFLMGKAVLADFLQPEARVAVEAEERRARFIQRAFTENFDPYYVTSQIFTAESATKWADTYAKASPNVSDDAKARKWLISNGFAFFANRLSPPEANPPPNPADAPKPEAASEAPAALALNVRVNRRDVNARTAAAANAGTSFSPELRAQQHLDEYVQHIENVALQLQPHATTPERKAALSTALEKYRVGYLKRFEAYLQAKSRVLSPMITGPSNFPKRANDKKSATEDKLRNELLDYIQQRSPLKELTGRISSDQVDALAAIQEKLLTAQRAQKYMKSVNAIVRSATNDDAKAAQIVTDHNVSPKEARALLVPDFLGRRGFPAYRLTNNNAEINRLQERLTQVESEKSKSTNDQMFDGVRVLDSAETNRIQLFYSDKPDQTTIDKLKRNGFKWSPSQQAWQRLRNDATRATLAREFNIVLDRASSDTDNPAQASWVQLGTRIDLDLDDGRTIELPAGAVLVTLADYSDLAIAYMAGPPVSYSDAAADATWQDFHDARTPGPTRAASTLDYGPTIGRIKAIRYDCQHGGQHQRRLHYFDRPLPVAFGTVEKIGIQLKNKRLRVTNRGIIG